MSDAKLCGECGCIHRPGENTLCPGWRPGPFVPDPTPERIAAALALAEACDAWHGSHGVATSRALEDAVLAYRATAPKPLRTRAERDHALAARALLWFMHTQGKFMTDATRGELAALCAEPTQADAIRERIEQLESYGSSSDRVDSPPRVDAAAGATFLQPWECSQHKSSGYGPIGCPLCRAELSGPRPTPATKESSDTAGVEAGAANRITDHDADQREPLEDPEVCSCEESEALKARITAILDCVFICRSDAYRVRDIVPTKLKEGL